jgi:hypothetical protein
MSDDTDYPCDLWQHDGYCDRRPATWCGLVPSVPLLWSDLAPPASLAFYCCEEHARRAPTAALDDARRTYGIVQDDSNGTPHLSHLWTALLAAHPEPIPIPTIDRAGAR